MNSYQMFYAKLAARNLRKNKETYIPYIVSCVVTVFLYFMLLAFTYNPGLEGIPDSESLKVLFNIGRGVVTVFAVIFLFYTNSFLMKRRKTEIGLYAILGLEKRHVARMLFYESLMIAAGTVGAAVVLGAVFGKLLFLLLARAVDFAGESTFIITREAVVPTLALFFGLFALTFVWNLIQVKTSSPINLLASDSAGEREPRANILLVLVGVLGIGFGYYEALTTESIYDAVFVFFVAVISVVIGTYAMFTSGSIAVLKKLKKSKRFYYEPEHFISVSNLMYRMKKNAVGLGNICILSTMVLIVVSTTVALYLGRQDMLEYRYKHDLEFTWENGNVPEGYARELAMREAKACGVAIEKEYDVHEASLQLFRDPKESDHFSVLMREDAYDMSDTEIVNNYCYLNFICLDDYNAMEGKKTALADDELLLFAQAGYYDLTSIRIFDRSFRVTELNELSYAGKKTGQQMMDSYMLVVKDLDIIEEMCRQYVKETENADYETVLKRHYAVDLRGGDADKRKFAENVTAAAGQSDARVESLDLQRDSWNANYGGLLFLGGFLGLLFLGALIMIVYFKQVSEGYEDAKRFLLLKKVGMDARDVRSTIYTQIRIVFLLPLVTAVVHEAVAFKIVRKLLLMFGLYNTKLIVVCTVAVTAVFAVLYLIIYLLTARTYDRIVEKHE